MAETVRIEGVREVIKNLIGTSADVEKKVIKGLVKAALFIQRESQLIVPVDTGTLKNSAFTRKYQSVRGAGTVVVVGYTADYAIYVHEDLKARHKEGKSAKFLEKPIREKRTEILEIIRKEASK